MKKLLAFLIFAAVAFAASSASAACGGGASNCFVVAGGGNSNSTATWSATSGGATCTCTPATTDKVILDSLAGQLTINAAATYAGFDMSGTGGSGSPYTNTLTHGAGATVTSTGNVVFATAGTMTYTGPNRAWIMTPASGTTITFKSAGNAINNLTVNAADATGVVQLVDALIQNGGGANPTLTITQGVFDSNSQNVTVCTLTANGANRTLSMGSTGTPLWTLATSASCATPTWTVGTTATVSSTTANLSFTGSTTVSTGGITFTGGAHTTYGTLTVNSAPEFFLINDSNTFANMSVSGTTKLAFAGGSTTTVTNAFTWTGTAANPMLITSQNISQSATISCATGSTIAWAGFHDITFSTCAMSPTNSLNFGGLNLNSGAISPPGGGGKIIGG